MDRAKINGVEIAYEVRGSGEPVMLCHCGFVAQDFSPLFSEPSIVERFTLINYHRRGYGGSERSEGALTMEQQAGDCLALMSYLGIEKVHLVGHSYGANVAIQTALSAPERIETLVLMEPTLLFALSQTSLPVIMNAISASIGQFAAGDKAGATDAFLQGAFGQDYRTVLDRVLPGAFEQAVFDSPTVFEGEMPGVQSWPVGPNEIAQIKLPVLSVFHVDPYWAGFHETHTALLGILPQAESLVIPNATHLLHLMNPRAVAEGLAGFLASHPFVTSYQQVADTRI